VPLAFVAVTVNVYAVPFVRPEIVHGLTNTHATGVSAVVEMYGVTVYPVIEAPPFEGAVQETTDWPSAFDDADTPVGAPGTVDGVAAADATDAAPVPLAFVAVTVNV